MNKLCSYLLMLVAIDMYGMELPKSVEEKKSIDIQNLFPTIYANVQSILEENSLELNDQWDESLAEAKKMFKIQYFKKNFNSDVSKERVLFYQLLDHIYPLNKDRTNSDLLNLKS